MSNDRQQQEQNQEKNEASTYSMEQQMRQQSPTQVPSPLCMLATAPSHQTGRLCSSERTACGMCSEGWMGHSSLFSHTIACSSLQLYLAALRMCMKQPRFMAIGSIIGPCCAGLKP